MHSFLLFQKKQNMGGVFSSVQQLIHSGPIRKKIFLAKVLIPRKTAEICCRFSIFPVSVGFQSFYPVFMFKM